MDRMIFWGASGQAKVLRECMRDSGRSLVAMFDRDSNVVTPFPEVPLLAGKASFESWLSRQSDVSSIGFLVAIGGHHGEERVELQHYLETFALTTLTAQHRTAFVAESAAIGAGSQVLAQAAVCVDAVVGQAVIVNTGAIVDHECRLGDGVHIGPGARLAGCVQVERFATVGTGAVVLPRVHIGERAVIGAGAVVLNDVPDGATVVGNPARPIS